MVGDAQTLAEPQCFGRPRSGVPAGAAAEVVVVGAGVGGSLLALVLARLGVRVTVVDLHAAYPDDFRCEKLNREQAEMLAELKVLDCFGSDPAGVTERGMRYADIVAAVRGAWPRAIRFVEGRAVAAERTTGLQTVILSSGERIPGRLIVLATGPSDKLRASLGVRRKLVRERHSVCIGFTLAPPEGGTFDFSGLVHHSERVGDGMAFASFFPIDDGMRVNLFAYRGPRETWTLGFRDDPLGRLFEAMPGLAPLLAGAGVTEAAEIRATDLYETERHDMDGVLLIGDAFRSCCPVTGMGITRILTEIRLLARTHLPDWLSTPGMDAAKIARFYADPVKRRIDERAARHAETARSAAIRTSLPWRARRGLAEMKRNLVAGAAARRARSPA